MAQIKDLKLTVEKGSMASKAKLKANFTVVFTPAEKKLNLHFGLFIMLYEVDFRPDILIPLPNGFNAMRFANLDASMNGTKNTQDDAIGWTKSGIIVPNGRNQLDIELSEEVRLINRNVTNESFRAGVYVSPEISAGFAWSDEVVIPCDPPKSIQIEQSYTKNTIQSVGNKTAPSTTTKKTVVKKIVKPKAPTKSTGKKAVVKKTVIKKVVAEKNIVNQVKQEALPNNVTKKPVVKKVVKKVVAEKNIVNPVKQEALPNNVTKKPIVKKVVKKVVAEKNVSNSIKQESVPSPVAKKAPAVKKKVTKTTIKSTSSRKPAVKKSTPNVAQQAPMANKEVTKPETKPDETSSPTDQKSSPKT